MAMMVTYSLGPCLVKPPVGGLLHHKHVMVRLVQLFVQLTAAWVMLPVQRDPDSNTRPGCVFFVAFVAHGLTVQLSVGLCFVIGFGDVDACQVNVYLWVHAIFTDILISTKLLQGKLITCLLQEAAACIGCLF